MSASTATKTSSARNKHSSINANCDTPKIDITKEEFSRITEAFKKEEFRKLFLDYCEEIQDPENRKLYEEEIKQFEAERGVDIRFLNPEPGFVVKTSVNGSLKCFVNVAKSPEVAKPTHEVSVSPDTGKRGLNWAIPMAQAAPRDDIDAQGKHCRVYDVIFHPDALYLSQRNISFRKCLIDTALDAVEREYKVNLDRTNLKFPKMQFKGIARPTVIRRLSKNPPPDVAEPHPLDGVSPPKPTAESGQLKVIPMKTNLTTKPEFSIPKYVIKHRHDVDLAEYTDELDAKLNITKPRELTVVIELPLLKSAAECQLDVTSKSLYLLSERPGAKYRLTLKLPYVVDDKRGNARFDTDTRRLSITLPVVEQSIEKQRDMHATLLHLNREDSGVESDIREEVHSNANSESPVAELSDSVEDANTTNEEAKDENDAPSIELATSITTARSTPANFLKKSIHYQFPEKFDCNVLDNVMSFVLHVRNVQSESIATLQQRKNLHLQFTSIGSGYYPTHYAFYMLLPEDANVEIATAEAEAWENNIVLNVNLATSSENLHSYLAGLDSNDLKEYTVQEKFQVVHNSRQRKKSPTITPPISLSSSLDISVERSECERSVEIEIKPRDNQHSSTCAANTTEDEDTQRADTEGGGKKMNKKQKKKNKKRRSLSESACDDINKAFQHQQHNQQQKGKQQFLKETPKLLQPIYDDTEGDEADGQSTPEDDLSPERSNVSVSKMQSVSQSVDVPTSNKVIRKQRSYSECRGDSVISSSAGSSTLPPSFKGILKRYSRYEPRPSISDSCSSIDECSLYSCSADTGVATPLHFSKSFSDIPEENVTDDLSESCKKTVRFNEVIKKQVFRLDSSILGQRKKNQKCRDRKQRALQRRLSEGDSFDYEDNIRDVALSNDETSISYNETDYSCKATIDGSNKKSAEVREKSGNHIKRNVRSNSGKCNKIRPRLESESSSDVDGTKNSMMFEMDM